MLKKWTDIQLFRSNENIANIMSFFNLIVSFFSE